jgi:uncharacterized membrane protein YdbT with pleckstrin-like domain
MRFNTKRDFSFLIIFLFVFSLYSGIALYSILIENDYTVLIPFSLILVFLAMSFLSILNTTYFILDHDKLICKCLFFKREIPYSNIRKVEKQTGIYAGIKFSTAWRGLVVYYNKYDDLLISPEKELEFMHEIQKKCPTIQI